MFRQYISFVSFAFPIVHGPRQFVCVCIYIYIYIYICCSWSATVSIYIYAVHGLRQFVYIYAVHARSRDFRVALMFMYQTLVHESLT